MTMGDTTLIRLSDVDTPLANTDVDLRDCKVIDAAGEEFGKVTDLYIDQGQGMVRFMEIASGGFLGLGQKKFIVPVDVVTEVSDEEVHIAKTKDDIVKGPGYDDSNAFENNHAYWTDAYGYYGYDPYWSPDYRDPLDRQ